MHSALPGYDIIEIVQFRVGNVTEQNQPMISLHCLRNRGISGNRIQRKELGEHLLHETHVLMHNRRNVENTCLGVQVSGNNGIRERMFERMVLTGKYKRKD